MTFVHTEEALRIARNTPEMDTESFWIFSAVTANGDVYQTMALFYELQEALTLIHNAIHDDYSWEITEMIIL